MTTLVLLIYAALSLVLGGCAATYEIWSAPAMLDRADGRGKFPSPKSTTGEAIGIGLFVALVWPVVVVIAIVDDWGEHR